MLNKPHYVHTTSPPQRLMIICIVLLKQNSRHDGWDLQSRQSIWTHRSYIKEILLKACWADMLYVCWGEHQLNIFVQLSWSNGVV